MEKSYPYILLGDIAEIVGETPNTLSQMMKRGGFTLPDANLRGGSGRVTKFSMRDVATIALIRSMINLGMQARTADQAVQHLIKQGGIGLDDIDQFIERWKNARAVISRSDEGWHFMMFETADDVAGAVAYITLNVASIVASTINEAREIAQFYQRRDARRA